MAEDSIKAAALFESDRLPEGDVLGQCVRIARLIGHGGMGRVYLGDDLLSGQQVAVKLLLPEVVCGPDELQRFISEAKHAATVNHPGIVRTFFIDVTEDGTPYQLMEYVPGAPLAKRIGQGPIAPASAARLAAAIAEMLGAAHDQGIIHSDGCL